MCNDFTEYQKRRMYNYYRGYSYDLIRNQTITLFYLDQYFKFSEIVQLKDHHIFSLSIETHLKSQCKKYIRIRNLYFYGYGREQNDYPFFFLDKSMQQLKIDDVAFIISQASKFAGLER